MHQVPSEELHGYAACRVQRQDLRLPGTAPATNSEPHILVYEKGPSRYNMLRGVRVLQNCEGFRGLRALGWLASFVGFNLRCFRLVQFVRVGCILRDVEVMQR